MYRYVVLIWDRTASLPEAAASLLSLRLREQSNDYIAAFSRPGLQVFAAGAQGTLDNHLLKRNFGLVLGSIFHRHKNPLDDSPSHVATFDARETEDIMKSRGRLLISEYWGNYVAVLADDEMRSVLVLKDPTGSLPCFITSWRGISIIFSCLQDCLDLGIFPFTVNWSYVEARIASNGADASHNPLNEVAQIHRGQCIEIQADHVPASSRQLYWRPVSFSEPSRAIYDVELAARALRATVRSVTRTLARGHSDILLRLSGGLDSSIVAGCLKDAASEARVIAYTGFSPVGKSDERRWARLSAKHAGFELVECPIDPSQTSLSAALQMQASVEPPRALVSLTRGEIEKRLATQRPYSALFSGHGGDSVFGAEAVRHVVDDFLRLRGPSFKALDISSAVALRTDTLTWTVLKGAMLRWIKGSTMDDFRDRLINKQSLAATRLQGTGLRTKYFPHPWFSEYEDVPWHVIRRVGALILTPEFYDPTQKLCANTPLELAPLYAQPVTELSLQIPLHVHFDEGIDRGLARKAFSDDVPIPILRRQWKDRAPGHVETIVIKNRTLFRDIVLGGALAQAHLIDCATIEGLLGGGFSKGAYFVGELFSLLDLELWMRHFTARSVDRAVA
jgi:asparagine synthase (glutamine-hydrolysing)